MASQAKSFFDYNHPERWEPTLPDFLVNGDSISTSGRTLGGFGYETLPFFKFYLAQKSLPLSEQEYESRLSLLKTSMFQYGIDACIFTSMHNIAHLEGIMRS